MALDKELYRKAYQLYREWNQAELQWQTRNAGKLSPQEAWEKYANLWEFCIKLAPPPSEQGNKLRSSKWGIYYERMQRIEAWRRTYGKEP